MFRALGLFFSMFSRLFTVGDKGLQALEKLADASVVLAESYKQELLEEADARQQRIAQLKAERQQRLAAPKKK